MIIILNRNSLQSLLPSFQSVFNERICKIYHRYFSSLCSHSVLLKQIAVPSKHIRPVRVTGRRQQKMMVILANVQRMETGGLDCQGGIDLEEIFLPINYVNLETNGFCSMQEHPTFCLGILITTMRSNSFTNTSIFKPKNFSGFVETLMLVRTKVTDEFNSHFILGLGLKLIKVLNIISN